MLEFWKRKEQRIALEWGMAGFETGTRTRCVFRSTSRNPVCYERYVSVGYTLQLLGVHSQPITTELTISVDC